MTTRSNAELADALDAHAVIHENEYQDDNQREWAKDLRDAAAALRAGVSKPTRYPWDQAPECWRKAMKKYAELPWGLRIGLGINGIAWIEQRAKELAEEQE